MVANKMILCPNVVFCPTAAGTPKSVKHGSENICSEEIPWIEDIFFGLREKISPIETNADPVSML
ncbi:hypothetical protein ccbrp13_16770 [Ktedonobacteria bacterium brp13]|nr:hypothetical protein ccbrp13_16770 [Ktedonobacteria bacterium brp13]